MSIRKITYDSSVCLFHVPCSEILFCLKGNWALKTVSGAPFIVGTLGHSPRELASFSEEGCNCPSVDNPRGDVILQYDLAYDDAQLNVDVGTGQPYAILCSDICGVSQDPCAKLMLDLILSR